MGWIFEAIVELLMQGVAIIMGALANSLINLFGLNGRETLDYFFAVFNGKETGVFNGNIGVFGAMYKICLIFSFILIFLNMIYQLFKALFGPLASADAPSRVIIKSIFYALLAAFSQSIIALVFDITTIPYNAIVNGTQRAEGDAVWKDVVSNMITKGPSNDTIGDELLALSPSAGIITGALAITLFFMLLKNFFATALELAERYLMLGLLSIIAPVCIACGATRGLEDVFKNWISWLINGCIVLIFSTFFLTVFIKSFAASTSPPYLLLWIAWFKTAQKIDEHMNALGLKTAKTGGFGMDVMNAMQNGLPGAMQLMNKATGRNMAIPFAGAMGMRHNGQVNPNDKNLMHMAGFKDGRLGEKSALTAGIGALAKKTGNKKLQSLSNKLSKAENKLSKDVTKIPEVLRSLPSGKPSFGGKYSGLSNDELLSYAASGKMPPKNSQEYQDIAKDLMASRVGAENVEKMAAQGYNYSDIKYDPKSDTMTFSAENENGTIFTGKITKDADADEGFIPVTGTDGESYGVTGAMQIDGVKQEGVPIFGDNSANNMDLNGPENMEETGNVAVNDGAHATLNKDELDSSNLSDAEKEKINQLAEENGGELSIKEDDIIRDEENGDSIRRYDENGNETEDGDYVKIDDGTEEGMLVPASIISDTVDENGNINLDENNSDVMVAASSPEEQIADDNLKEKENISSIQDGDNEYKVQSTDEAGVITAENDEGNSAQYIDKGNGEVVKIPQDEKIEEENVQTLPKTAVDGDNNYELSAPDENNIMHGVSTTNPDDTKDFVNNGDGTVSAVEKTIAPDDVKDATTVNTSDGDFKLSGEPDENGLITGVNTETGEEAKFKNNGDGSYSMVSNEPPANIEKTAQVGDETFALGEKDENGIIHGVSTTDPENKKDFIDNGDGTYSAIQTISDDDVSIENNTITLNTDNTEKGKYSLLGEPDENGIVTGENKDRETATFKDNGDGTYTMISEPVSMENTISAGGETYKLSEPDENGIIHGTSTTNPDNQQNFVVNNDGTLSQVQETIGTSLTIGDDTYNLTGKTDDNGYMIGTNKDTGEETRFKKNDDGSYSQIANDSIKTSGEFTSVKDSEGNSYRLDNNFSDDAPVVSGVDSKGNTALFERNDDGSVTKLASGEQIAPSNIQSQTSIIDADNVSYNVDLNKPEANGTFKGIASDGSGKEVDLVKHDDGSLSKLETSEISLSDKSYNKDDNKLSYGDKTYDLSGKADKDGYVNGTAADGSTAKFKIDEAKNTATMVAEQPITAPVQETRTITDSTSNNYTLGVTNSNGIAIGKNQETGENVAFRENKDGSFTRLDATSTISSDNVTREKMPITAKDSTGVNYSDFKSNGDGTFTGKAEGREATFKYDDKGNLQKISESRQIDASQGIQKEYSNLTSVSNNNGTYSATDSDGKTYTDIRKQSNGSYVGRDENGDTANFRMNEYGNLQKENYVATDTSGNKFNISSSAVHDSVRDTSGNIQHIDTTQAVREVDSSKGIKTSYSDISSATKTDSGYSDIRDAKGNTYSSVSKIGDNTYIGTDASGNTATFVEKDGKLQQEKYIATDTKGTSFEVSSNLVTRDKEGNPQMSNGAVAVNTSGQQVMVSSSNVEQNKSGESYVRTTKSTDLSSYTTSVASNTMQHSHISFTNNEEDNKPVDYLVKSEKGSFFRPQSAQRYDIEGKPARDGGYMKDTSGALVSVSTRHGNVPTYDYKDGTEFGSVVVKRNGEYVVPAHDDANISVSYRPVRGNEIPTAVYAGDSYKKTIEPFSNDIDGKPQAPIYVKHNGQELRVDNSKTKFNSEGVPLDNHGKLSVIGKDGKSMEIDVRELDGKNNRFSCYTKYENTHNGETQVNLLNIRDAKGYSYARPDSTLYGDVPEKFNMRSATIKPLTYENGQPTGSFIYYYKGETYLMHKEGTNITHCDSSAKVQFGGSIYTCEPMPGNAIGRDLYNMGLSNGGSFRTVKESPQLRTFAKKYGIPHNAKSIRVQNNGEGNFIITYNADGKTYAISPSRVSQGDRKGIKNEEVVNESSVRNKFYRYELASESTKIIPRKITNESKVKLAIRMIFKKNK